MAVILDKQVVQDTTPDAATGLVEVFKTGLPSDAYMGITIGPASDHDIVRVRYPGVDSLLFRGIMLPVPPSAQSQGVFIEVETVRPFSGRLQVIGVLHSDEMNAVARLRAPRIQEDVISVPLAGSIDVEVFNAGRRTVNLTATIGGNTGGVVGIPPAVSPSINIETLGRLYRRNLSGALISENNQYVEFPLNAPKWPTGLGEIRTFSWNEEEPEFDSIIYRFSAFGGDAPWPMWYRTEARD